jgi:hypothetical protein
VLKVDAAEANPIVRQAMQNLLLTVITKSGRSGSDARTAIGDLLAHLDVLLYEDTLGVPLSACFDRVREAGATPQGIGVVYHDALMQAPVTRGGLLVRDSVLNFCFGTVSRLLADIKFRSREDVEAAKQSLSAAFTTLEEIVADAMDSPLYTSVIRLHAATTRFLINTERPLPRMLEFRFAAPMLTLTAAHRLYNDAGRADELRDENRVIHPAFMKPTGRALSA